MVIVIFSIPAHCQSSMVGAFVISQHISISLFQKKKPGLNETAQTP